MEELQGTVTQVVYRSEETGYSVFRLQFEKKNFIYTISAVGTFFQLDKNEFIKLWGEFKENKKYGRQFAVDHYESSFPANLNALETYLAKGVIKGIGPVLAKRIVREFGMDTISILKEHPDRLKEVPGIGSGRAERIILSLKEHGSIAETFLQLAKMGITATVGNKIFQTYKENTLHVLQTNPYEVIEKVRGVGFLTIDRIGLMNGIPENSPFRISSGLVYTMRQAMSAGNICYPLEKMSGQAGKLLGLPDGKVRDVLEKKIMDGTFTEVDRDGSSYVYLSPVFHAEQETAGILKQLSRPVAVQNVSRIIRRVGKGLDETQQSAVVAAVQSGAMVLTGGPGVGKTTTTNKIIQAFDLLKKKVMLAAPTGKAAKRLSESTGRETRTIHRTLGIQPDTGGYEYNKDNRLECDVMVIDEVSMVDLQLMHALLQALRDDAQLVLVGDKHQLPSVGAGNVIADIISSGIMPVVELTQIYRQAGGSEIITNAYSLLNHSSFAISNRKDFFFKPAESPEEILDLVLHYAGDSLPAYTGEKQVQVLTPLRGRMLGTEALNTALQEKLNPGAPLVHGYRVGDKVINIRNNYEMEKVNGRKRESGVFNGDTGTVAAINEQDEYITVEFDDGWSADYSFRDLDNLSLSYALTIHKSQGSEYPVVIIPVWDYIPMLTTMSLLYTGITRAKKCILLVGSKAKLIQIARNRRAGERYTGLEDALKNNE